MASSSYVFTLGNRSIEHEFVISNYQQTPLFVNLIENRVDDLESTPVKMTTTRVHIVVQFITKFAFKIKAIIA